MTGWRQSKNMRGDKERKMETEIKYLKVMDLETKKSRIFQVYIAGRNYLYIYNEKPHSGELLALLESEELESYVAVATEFNEFKNEYPYGYAAFNYKGDQFVDGITRSIDVDERIVVKKITNIDGLRETTDILKVDADDYITDIDTCDLREILSAVKHLSAFYPKMFKTKFKVSDASEEAEFIKSIKLMDPELKTF